MFLFNIAQCHRQLGQYEEAARFYHNYLRESPRASNRADAERLATEMERLAAARVASVPPTGVQPRVEGKAEQVKPTAEAHRAAAVEAATRVEASPPPVRKKTKPWVWAVVGVAGALLVGGAVGLAVGLSSSSGAPSSSLGTYGVGFQ